MMTPLRKRPFLTLIPPLLLTALWLLAALWLAVSFAGCSEEEKGLGSASGTAQAGSTETVPAPDLSVRLDAVAHDASAGTWVLYTISNTGDADAGPFDLDVFANSNGAPAAGTFGDEFVVYAGLSAGVSFQDGRQLTETVLTSGTAYATVDTSNFVTEQAEDNNVSPSLAWGDVTTPSATLDFEDGLQPEGLVSLNSTEQIELNWGFDSEGAAASGTMSLASGPIGDSQWTCLAYDPGAATSRLAFHRKVSSQEGYDGLDLFMDETPVFFWSGGMDWERFTLSMPAGPRVYTLCYSKDPDSLAGADSAWIDLLEVE